MRRCLQMMSRLAAIRRPEKQKLYEQLYPLIDDALDGHGRLAESKFKEAMTTADFAFALGEFVDRALWPAYRRAVFNFAPLVFTDTVTNFQTVTRYQRQAGLDDLEIVGTKGVTFAGSIADAAKRTYKVYRWEKGFDFAMEAIIDDDLGYFRDFATLMGEAARRTLEKFVSRLYFNTTTIAGLQALGALYSTTSRLSTNALMVAWAAFNQRTDANSEPITTAPVYLVIHRGLRPTAEQILRSVQVAENANNNLNVLPPLRVIEDPYLTGTTPNLPWYLFSDSNLNGIRPITLVRMNAIPGPLIMQKAPDTMTFGGFGRLGGIIPNIGDFMTGNIMLKVMDIWGGATDATYAGLTDYRGAYYSSGTVP